MYQWVWRAHTRFGVERGVFGGLALVARALSEQDETRLLAARAHRLRVPPPPTHFGARQLALVLYVQHGGRQRAPCRVAREQIHSCTRFIGKLSDTLRSTRLQLYVCNVLHMYVH